MSYSLSGLANTAKGTYFVGFASSGGTPNCNSNSGSYSRTSYPYYFSLESGLLTSYGTNGLGAAYTSETNNTGNCSSGDDSFGSSSFINSEGRPARVGQLAAIGSQTAGLAYVLWDAADGVTGGGDGTVSTASAAGRVDTKVYSTKLPTIAQPDSALTVLTAKQAQDLDIRTSTPKICIALTTSVLLVNPGRCVVRIIDEDTKKVLRTMTTTVKKSEVEAGTTLTTDEPIMFKQASIKLSKQAQAQVAELAAAAKSASRIVVIGHSASLGEVSAYSYAISRDRALAVKAALVKAGVKATIEIVALSYSQPESTKKTEAAQAKNRRAEVFLFP
jgi:outer membrane protein OmpA-like peptidoglycan-associated protein